METWVILNWYLDDQKGGKDDAVGQKEKGKIKIFSLSMQAGTIDGVR